MKRRIIIGLLLILVLMIAGVGVWNHFNNKQIEVSEYSLDADLGTDIRIVQLSDFHCAALGEKGDNQELIDLVKEQKPDVIFLTGDFINKDEEDITNALNLMKELTSVSDVYACMGNHEYEWNETFQSELGSIETQYINQGVGLLDADYVDVNIKGVLVRIGGYMGYYGFPGMLSTDSTVLEIHNLFYDTFEDTDRYKILLDHIPTSWVDWDNNEEFDVDLVFSGHYHGGQVRIPGIGGIIAPYVGLFPKYTKGMYEGKRAYCVVSSGIGNEMPVPRVNNPPEIVVLNLK